MTEPTSQSTRPENRRDGLSAPAEKPIDIKNACMRRLRSATWQGPGADRGNPVRASHHRAGRDGTMAAAVSKSPAGEVFGSTGAIILKERFAAPCGAARCRGDICPSQSAAASFNPAKKIMDQSTEAAIYQNSSPKAEPRITRGSICSDKLWPADPENQSETGILTGVGWAVAALHDGAALCPQAPIWVCFWNEPTTSAGCDDADLTSWPPSRKPLRRPVWQRFKYHATTIEVCGAGQPITSMVLAQGAMGRYRPLLIRSSTPPKESIRRRWFRSGRCRHEEKKQPTDTPLPARWKNVTVRAIPVNGFRRAQRKSMWNVHPGQTLAVVGEIPARVSRTLARRHYRPAAARRTGRSTFDRKRDLPPRWPPTAPSKTCARCR